jgi:hypothetical protein
MHLWELCCRCQVSRALFVAEASPRSCSFETFLLQHGHIDVGGLHIPLVLCVHRHNLALESPR